MNSLLQPGEKKEGMGDILGSLAPSGGIELGRHETADLQYSSHRGPAKFISFRFTFFLHIRIDLNTTQVMLLISDNLGCIYLFRVETPFVQHLFCGN